MSYMINQLSEAVKAGNLHEVSFLLSRKHSVNAQDKFGVTALQLAAMNGFEDILIQLLENGAKLNDCDTDGFTALHLAASNGHIECVNLLINYKAAVNVKDRSGATPSHYAKQNGHDDILNVLHCKRTRKEILTDVNQMEQSCISP